MTSWKLTGCTCFQTFDLGTNNFGAESYLSNFGKFGIFTTLFWTWDSALFWVFLTVKGLSLRTSCFVLRYSWRPRLVSLPVKAIDEFVGRFKRSFVRIFLSSMTHWRHRVSKFLVSCSWILNRVTSSYPDFSNRNSRFCFTIASGFFDNNGGCLLSNR